MSKTEQVKNFFHGYARSFDGIYMQTSERKPITRLIDRWFRKSMYQRFQLTLDNLNAPTINNILDIGCGPGRYCVEYLKMGKRVTGIDLADGMLKIAKGVCATESSSGQAQFILGNYMDLNFPDKFDAAVLMGLFDYIEDPIAFFKKLKQDVSKIILASFPRAGGLLAFQRKIRYKLKKCPLFLYELKDIQNILSSVGIDNYNIISTDREYFLKVNLDEANNK